MLLIVAALSCQNNEDKFQLSSFEKLKDVKDDCLIYVLPGSGCNGCISNIENLALENVNSSNKYFVFTRLISLKIFKTRFKTLYNADNVIIDTLNQFVYLNKKNEIYPVMFRKKNQKYKFVKFIKP